MLLVKQFREERGISQIAAANAIREYYPGMDKHLLSKVENPDKYGIRLTNGAEQALEDAFATTAVKARKPEKRRKPIKIQCRLTKGRFERLQRALNAAGYDTMQDGLEFIINSWLEGMTKEKAGQGSSLDTGNDGIITKSISE